MEKEQDTVLKLKHISVVFDGFKALTDVDINVKRHTIHFFIGPNGARKINNNSFYHELNK